MSFTSVILLVVTLAAIILFVDYEKRIKSHLEEIDKLSKEVAAGRNEAVKRIVDAEARILQTYVKFQERARGFSLPAYAGCVSQDFPHFIEAMAGVSRSDRGDPAPQLLSYFMDILSFPSLEGNARVLLSVLRSEGACRELEDQFNKWQAEQEARSR